MITKKIELGDIRLMPRWTAAEKTLYAETRLNLGIFDVWGSGRFSDTGDPIYSLSIGTRIGRALLVRAYAMGEAGKQWKPNFSAMLRTGALYLRASYLPMGDRGNVTAQIRFLRRNYLMFDGFFVNGQDTKYTISASFNLPIRITYRVPEPRLPVDPGRKIIFK